MTKTDGKITRLFSLLIATLGLCAWVGCQPSGSEGGNESDESPATNNAASSADSGASPDAGEPESNGSPEIGAATQGGASSQGAPGGAAPETTVDTNELVTIMGQLEELRTQDDEIRAKLAEVEAKALEDETLKGLHESLTALQETNKVQVFALMKETAPDSAEQIDRFQTLDNEIATLETEFAEKSQVADTADAPEALADELVDMQKQLRELETEQQTLAQTIQPLIVQLQQNEEYQAMEAQFREQFAEVQEKTIEKMKSIDSEVQTWLDAREDLNQKHSTLMQKAQTIYQPAQGAQAPAGNTPAPQLPTPIPAPETAGEESPE